MDASVYIQGAKASTLPESSLPLIESTLLCQDYIRGFCRNSDLCAKSHEICNIDKPTTGRSQVPCIPNRLSSQSRLPNQAFDNDGPGILAELGPRHDNDHVEIERIQILPSMDEILSLRRPYMPSRHPHALHRLPLGFPRLLDINFRQLRYDSVEKVMDCMYHASQRLHTMAGRALSPTDYDDRTVTPKGSRYSFFHGVAFEEIMFHERKGVMFRISFACPPGLRGTRMGTSGHLEDGMLVALVGLDSADLSVTFMEIHQRQTTAAMMPRTRNHLRGKRDMFLAD